MGNASTAAPMCSHTLIWPGVKMTYARRSNTNVATAHRARMATPMNRYPAMFRWMLSLPMASKMPVHAPGTRLMMTDSRATASSTMNDHSPRSGTFVTTTVTTSRMTNTTPSAGWREIRMWNGSCPLSDMYAAPLSPFRAVSRSRCLPAS